MCWSDSSGDVFLFPRFHHPCHRMQYNCLHFHMVVEFYQLNKHLNNKAKLKRCISYFRFVTSEMQTSWVSSLEKTYFFFFFAKKTSPECTSRMMGDKTTVKQEMWSDLNLVQRNWQETHSTYERNQAVGVTHSVPHLNATEYHVRRGWWLYRLSDWEGSGEVLRVSIQGMFPFKGR